jgi:hypothetical protein
MTRKSKTKLRNFEKETKTKVSLTKCAPGIIDDNKGYSCFGWDGLVKIAKAWNEQHYSNQVKIPMKNTKTNEKKLWNELDLRLRSKCDSEWCWIEQEFVRRLHDKKLRSSFKPKKPLSWKKNKNEWLTTIDINSVMKQYENKYDYFKFIGPVPIDFDYEYQVGQCIVNELCNIKLAHLINKNIKKVGIIFNLDPHDKPGSHWVALYLDLVKDKVYYFDSYGMEPPSEVKRLVDRIKEQGNSLGKDIEYEYNQTRHQYKNSECGVYSMNFIVELLEGRKSFKKIQAEPIKDESMTRKRDFFYMERGN